MKKTMVFMLAVAILMSLCSCGKKTDEQILSDVSIPSVVVTPATVTPDVTSVETADPSFTVNWSSMTDLPADFPVLSSKVTAVETTPVGTVVKWNVLNSQTVDKYVAAIGKWAGYALHKTTGDESVKYYLNDLTVGESKYDISLVYIAGQTGSYVSDISDWMSQATLYIYETKAGASSKAAPKTAASKVAVSKAVSK